MHDFTNELIIQYKQIFSYKMQPGTEKAQQKKKTNHSTQQPLPPTQQIGPNPRKLQKLDLSDILLQNIPASQNYEISYMHRDVVTNIITSNKTDMIITFSVDGHIKFWRKVFHLIEFAKNFKAHSGLITCASLNKDHDSLCTVGIDKTLKVFDVLNCDLRTIVRLPFTPSACEFLPRKGFDLPLIAVSEDKSGKIMIINTEKQQVGQNQDDIGGQNDFFGNNQLGQQQKSKKEKEKQYNFNDQVIRTLSFHRHPIKFIKMNWAYKFCVSIDERAFLQVWDTQTFDFPSSTKYRCKIESQFLQLLQQNSIPIGMSLSPKGNLIAIILKDKTINVFNLISGKNVVVINESIKQITRIQEQVTHPQHDQEAIDEADFQRKLSIQKQIEVSKQFLSAPHLDFDEAQEFIVYPSFRGIKVYSLKKKQVQRILGKKEHQRFIKTCLYQGKMMRNPSGTSNSIGQRKSADPTIYCTSFKRPRFYIFSRRSPEIGKQVQIVRDIINERNTKDQQISKDQIKLIEKKNQVTLHTTLGDISVELFLQDCPKTSENFIQLSRKGYYNNLIFHRVIKNFMIQSGCPKGDGTGGESIWGGVFEDELCPQKHRFDRPYLLAMANPGRPNSNGSQFFITVVACPWLDNKHTVFGRVVKGIETVCQINRLKTDKTQKPLVNVKIISTTIK